MSDTLVLGTRKGVFLVERGTREWRVVRRAHPGVPVVYAWIDGRSGTLWTCLEHGHWGGKLARSKTRGETWEEIPAPKYPEGAEVKDGVPATLGYLWCMGPGGADQPGRLYIGTVPGGLFRSEDSGATWSLVGGLWNHPSRKEHWFSGGLDKEYAGICSILVDPRNSARVLVGISCGGVFETSDDGASWTHRNKGLRATFLPNPEADFGHDPHFTALCEREPDVLWQQNHCGIFRSTDGARTWTEVSQTGGPAYFGFAIAADARDPERAWVVPQTGDEERTAVGGALLACRTDDGGKTWAALRDGLPQENAYDVVYRHALDARGDRVAFGSTTGNVYLSEDRGERWTCLGNNFPPVYSVRFA